MDRTATPLKPHTRSSIERKLLSNLFEEHRTWLQRLIQQRTGDPELARDLVQETFLRAHRAATRINLSSGPGPYLKRIAHNLLMRHYTSNALTVPTGRLEETAAREAERERDDLEYSVRSALDTLPLPQRQVAELRFYEGCGYEEVSGQLGISVRTAKRRMQEARTSLRKRLSP